MHKESKNKIKIFLQYVLLSLFVVLMIFSNKKLKNREKRNKNKISVRILKRNNIVTDKFFVNPNGIQWKERIFKNTKELIPYRRYFLYDTNKDGKVNVIVLMYRSIEDWRAVIQIRGEEKYISRFESADNEIKEMLKVKITKFINPKNK